MLATLVHLGLLLAVCLALDEDCQSEWFGNKCTLMCHCNTSCDMRGACFPRNYCVAPYFGPSCQYVDLTMDVGVEMNPPELNKQDHPCKQNMSLTSVSVSFKSPKPFSWLRVQASDSELLLNFTVVINGDDICYNERRFQLSNTEVDVTCDSNLLLSKLELQGSVAQSICSIRISGGRNVALKQNTSQSSSLMPKESNMGESFRAVDGNSQALITQETCAMTQSEPAGPSWCLMFSRPQILYNVYIIARQDNQSSLLHGLILETYNQFQNLTERYVDPNTFAPSYNVSLKSRQLVSSLRIFRPPLFGMTEVTLTLCEVLVYGETICPDGLYGLQCLYICLCEETEICNLVTGACSPGCDEGMYGFNCSSNCSNLCYEGKCKNRFGACLHCIPGRTGDNCERTCKAGTYGLDCKQVCSVNCLDVCNAENGACSCADNFLIPLCQECSPGFYGANCTYTCPVTCENRLCNKSTGNCLSCMGGRVGIHCQDCPNTYYGSLCYTKCSTYCLNETCDQENGTCPDCSQGYSGPQCVISPESKPALTMLLTLPIASVLVGLCALFLLRRKASSLRDDVEDTRDNSISVESSTFTSDTRSLQPL